MEELKGIEALCVPSMITKTRLAKRENGEYLLLTETEAKKIVADILDIINEYKDVVSVGKLIEDIKDK